MVHQSAQDGKWEKHSIFTFLLLDETGALTTFQTSKTKTDTPTQTVNGFQTHALLKSGKILRIHYRLNPTNAVTYTLRFWRWAVANDYESNLYLLWESPPLQADDLDYDRAELNIPFFLCENGKMYFSIEWTGAPGVTSGFISVEGEAVE